MGKKEDSETFFVVDVSKALHSLARRSRSLAAGLTNTHVLNATVQDLRMRAVLVEKVGASLAAATTRHQRGRWSELRGLEGPNLDHPRTLVERANGW